MTDEWFALIFITFVTGACFGAMTVTWFMMREEREKERDKERTRRKWIDAQIYRERWNEEHGYSKPESQNEE